MLKMTLGAIGSILVSEKQAPDSVQGRFRFAILSFLNRNLKKALGLLALLFKP